MNTVLPRDSEAIRLLALRRFLIRPQLEELLFAGSTLTPRSRQVVTWRLLARLQRRGHFAATPRQTGGAVAGSTLPGYFLTPAGLRLAAAFCPDLPARRPARRATFLFAHSLATTEVELAFRRAARAHPWHELQLWESDWQIAMRVGRSAVVPDARFVYRIARREYHAFIEVDLGTEGTRFFGRKVGRYLDLYRGGAWRAYVPVWPRILIVTSTDARAASLCATTTATLRSQLLSAQFTQATEFFFCSIDAIRGKSGPFAALWRVAGAEEPRPLLTAEQIARTDG